MITPITELEAVNMMLASIGEAPINTLDVAGLVSARTAYTLLKRTSLEVQQEGWHFNTELQMKLPLNSGGEAHLPSNTLRVDVSGPDEWRKVVQRGTRLYDVEKHSYKFDRDLTVDLVVGLGFDELPQAARHYITVKAGRRFTNGLVQNDLMFRFADIDERQARADIIQHDAETGDFNVFFDRDIAHYTVARRF